MLLFMTYSEEEQEKFTSIFRQHYRVLIGKAYDILHSHHLAEDAVEEAFIRALKHLDRLSETDSMRTRRFSGNSRENRHYDVSQKSKDRTNRF